MADGAKIGGFTITSGWMDGNANAGISVSSSGMTAKLGFGTQYGGNTIFYATDARIGTLYLNNQATFNGFSSNGTNTFTSVTDGDKPLNVNCNNGQGKIYLQGIKGAGSDSASIYEGPVQVYKDSAGRKLLCL